MKPIVHWLRYEPASSGLYTYTYSLHKATKALGYESHICYSDSDLKTGGKIKVPHPAVGEIDFSPWSVCDGAINIIHDMPPHMKLDNLVAEMHATPRYAAKSIESLSATMYHLEHAELILTRFPSHVQYWEQATHAPIHVIPPGVNLDFWTPKGPAMQFQRPTILWADTIRDGVKDPTDLLYAMKIVNKELPEYGLHIVAIPPNEIAGYAYYVGALRLDSIVDFPLVPMFQDMDALYRGVRNSGGLMYSDTNAEGSNASWEAEAIGLPVIHHQNNPKDIANEIISEIKNPHHHPITRDIKDTAKAMVSILESYFPDSRQH